MKKCLAILFLVLFILIVIFFLFGCPQLISSSSRGTPTEITKTNRSENILRLGAWNIKKLGHGDEKDYKLVAKIIAENFDILVVVEAMQKKGSCPGYDDLLESLGSDWEGLRTEEPRPFGPSGNSEFYAILYRKNFVRTCQNWNTLRYHKDADGSMPDMKGDYFVREPAFGCFEVFRDQTVVFDFLLAAYHATWSEGKISTIQNEVSHIGKVFTEMRKARRGEKDIFLAGDFNLVPKKLSEVIRVYDQTTGVASTINSKGELSKNLYDHLLVWDRAASREILEDAKVLDIRKEAKTPKIFYETVSDHLPIQTRINIKGPDDD